MAISPQRVIRYTSYLVLGWGFREGRSNSAISGSNKPPAAILEKFQMAISPQPVVPSTPSLVLGWDFVDGRSNMALFPVRTNPRWWRHLHRHRHRRHPILEKFRMAISPQRLIRCTYIARVIFAIAQLSCTSCMRQVRIFYVSRPT